MSLCRTTNETKELKFSKNIVLYTGKQIKTPTAIFKLLDIC